jgi:uncharacterized protein DUF1592/uncharacterized protein DUF1588/uncharacterized protein DUF1585/uncharacterized protein DUF1595/uncharacterized protein DUF1587
MKISPSLAGAFGICLSLGLLAPACGGDQHAGGASGPGGSAGGAPGGGSAGAPVGGSPFGGLGGAIGGSPSGGAGGSVATGSGASAAAGAGGLTAQGGAAGAATGAAGGAGTAANNAGLRPLRLMTQREYANTIRDLLGGQVVEPADLPADTDSLASGFAFHTTGVVTQPAALQYQGAAEAVAAAAPFTTIATGLPCAATAGASPDTETACLATFFGPSGLATSIYRRPLSTTAVTGEVARLTALYQSERAAAGTGPDMSEAIGFVVEAMLQTPGFLYHWELDPGPATVEGTLVKLGNYEIANRLSYFLWGTMPDATLFAAAAAGQLGDLASVETQVRRMLMDPKAAGTFTDFFIDWLDLDVPSAPKDPAVYPPYTAALAGAMTGEVDSFVNAIVVGGSDRFDDILTGTSSFANQGLAALYGIPGVTATALSPVALNPAQRSGLFTTAAFLSATGDPATSDPPRRGNAIYQKLLCQILPEAIPVMPSAGSPAPGGGTTRQLFASYGTMACATACHATIDPLGDTFESYDGIGTFRTTDNGAAVDTSATVTLDGQPRAVADARGLLAVMATSDEVQTCFARQWLRYGLGRLDTAQDLTSLDAAASAFKSSMRDIRELVLAIATSPTFRYRTPGTGEVLQ